MGRAKGQPHAIATASFEAVLGGRRGATGASERPDKELETALAALNSGDPDSAYLVLRGRRNTTGNDAATEQLMAALSATLADSQLEAWGSTMRGALERSGFKQSDRAHTLVSRKYSPIVHIWPDGEQYTDIPDDKYSTRATGFPGVTLCGIEMTDVFKKGWRQSFQGDFTADTDRVRPCKKCQKKMQPGQFHEAEEPYLHHEGRSPLPPEWMDRWRKREQLAATVRLEQAVQANTAFAEAFTLESSEVRQLATEYMQERAPVMILQALEHGLGFGRDAEKRLGYTFAQSHDPKFIAQPMRMADYQEIAEIILPDKPTKYFGDYDSTRRKMEAIILNAHEEALTDPNAAAATPAAA